MSVATAQSIKLAGTDLAGSSYEVLVINRDRFDVPEPRVIWQRLSGADGEVSFGSQWESPVFRLQCAICTTTNSDTETKISALRTLLANNAVAGEMTLVFGWIAGKSYNVRLMNKPDFRISTVGATFELSFKASNPLGA